MPSDSFVANAETKVPVSRSVDHIRALVERFQAQEFRTIYVDGQPSAIRFTIRDPHLAAAGDGPCDFTVELTAPSDWLTDQFDRRRVSWDRARCRQQAERVAWRQLHDIIRSTLIGVQAGLFTIGEAFLANLIVETEDGEERFGELLMRTRALQPGGGGAMRLLGKG